MVKAHDLRVEVANLPDGGQTSTVVRFVELECGHGLDLAITSALGNCPKSVRCEGCRVGAAPGPWFEEPT